MIGEKIITENGAYTIIGQITTEVRPNANIYLCQDINGNKFVAKHFYNQTPMSNIALGEYNHYGRRRDGSDLVFNEIKEKNKTFSFLVKHIDRIKFKGKWIIILEFVEGVPLSNYIKATCKMDIKKVEEAIINFSKAIAEWHTNGFAHGDPHLDNVMIDPVTMKVKLIDYSQIHHPDFFYCRQYNCFYPDRNLRMKHDLDNYTSKLGEGFKNCLGYLQDELRLGTLLIDTFEKHYSIEF